MALLQKVTSNILVTLIKNETVKEITEAIALIELEEAISEMCYEK